MFGFKTCMKVTTNNPKQNNTPSFKFNPLIWSAANVEQRVMVNKAIMDAGVDVPIVMMSNNKEERRERATRIGLTWVLAFATPFVTLPLTNRLAMKHIAKLTTKFTAKESKLINLSNGCLKNKEETEKGIAALAEKLNIDFSAPLNRACGDYEKLRQKMINAKMAVLSFDYLFTAGVMGGLAYWNVWYTKKKTGRDGFAAEFEMADKTVIDKRAESYKKYENLRRGIFLTGLALLTLSPLLIKRGLSSNTPGKFNDFIKKNAALFDYNDGIWMRRVPFMATMAAGYTGVVMASRNSTELRDSCSRMALLFPSYFVGDLVIGSVFGIISDTLLKTNIINKKQPNKLWYKIFPQTTRIENLAGKSQVIQACLFWLNIATLACSIGFGVPYVLNKIIRHDVKKDAEKLGQKKPETIFTQRQRDIINKLLKHHTM